MHDEIAPVFDAIDAELVAGSAETTDQLEQLEKEEMQDIQVLFGT